MSVGFGHLWGHLCLSSTPLESSHLWVYLRGRWHSLSRTSTAEEKMRGCRDEGSGREGQRKRKKLGRREGDGEGVRTKREITPEFWWVLSQHHPGDLLLV